MDLHRTNRRIAILLCFFATIYSVFAVRLIQIQVWQHAEYKAEARERHVKKVNVPAQRGSVRDIRGEVLAANLPLKKIVLDGTLFRVARSDTPKKPTAADLQRQAGENAAIAASTIARSLELDEAARIQLQEKILEAVAVPEERDGKRYLVLRRRVSDPQANTLRLALEQQKIRGITFEPDPKRVYPNGSLLSHVVGYLDPDGGGLQGIEKSMDRYLAGQPGYRWIEKDGVGNELAQYRGVEQEPRDGSDVVLTVDTAIQSIVEQELEAACAKYRPEMATVVMMRPRTGEILAMASKPDFDPNSLGATRLEQMRNRAITDMVEPGSIFKIVAVAAVLNEARVRPDTTVFCENGRWEFGGSLLRDAHPFGTLTVHDIIVHSSNIGAAKLAVQLGARPFHRYIRDFGFGSRTGVELPSEISGIVHPVERWSAISISRIPMGHEIGVTPLQMTAAMCAIANDGEWLMPRIVHSILNSRTGATSVVSENSPPRRIVSEKAARQLRSALEDVVGPKGTAKGAAVRGFKVAGKTGTAQRVDAKNGGYLRGEYVVSFLGYLPAENPEFVCLVLFDNAHTKPNENFGGLVAAPVFSRIAERTAQHLGLEPAPELNEKTGPKLAGNPARD